MITIEQHYNKLLSEVNRTEVTCTGKTLYNLEYYALDNLRVRLCRKANELARQDWPNVRSSLAEESQVLPEQPLHYAINLNAYVGKHSFGGLGFNTQREPTKYEPDYLKQAFKALLPEFELEAARAKKAFETYRLAVAQGVAVAPQNAEQDTE